jgi:hypothetical protein
LRAKKSAAKWKNFKLLDIQIIMKLLPVDLASFDELRDKDYLYVDKTEVLHHLTQSGKFFFLTRPKRFGKSLAISTLEHLFLGHETLFQGLFIRDKWDWNQSYPVIHLDWTGFRRDTPDQVELGIGHQVRSIARGHGITFPDNWPAANCFSELIQQLKRLKGRRVVVLVDEYDAPIIKHIGKNDEVLAQILENLHDFYQVLKFNDANLHFVFLTGVSKFSGLSIFSAMNILRDITLDSRYNDICGYTQQELEDNFQAHIESVAEKFEKSREELLAAIKTHYNGYSWNGETTIYNPFFIMNFFENQEFGDYWFRSGTPSFFFEKLKNSDLESLLEELKTDKKFFDGYDPAFIEDIPLLFQAGCLTVKHKTTVFDQCSEYTLGIPNTEVHNAMYGHLLGGRVCQSDVNTFDLKRRILIALQNHNTDELEKCLKEMIACIPYQIIPDSEAWYHSTMLFWLKLLGFELIGEVPTNIGRMDAVWFCPNHTIVVEVKYSAKTEHIDQLAANAIAQIREKRYYERFVGHQQISLLGVAFAGKEIGCKMEKL